MGKGEYKARKEEQEVQQRGAHMGKGPDETAAVHDKQIKLAWRQGCSRCV
jgi:hypothetical protein